MKEALFIGRFQPPHNGHVEKLKHLDTLGLKQIIIGIGIETDGFGFKGRTEKNPFTPDEIMNMLHELQFNTQISIFFIPDINDPQNYAKHVENITGCSKDKTYIVSDNLYTTDCFPNYKILKTKRYIKIGKDYLCATKIRQMIKDNENWRQYVPDSTRRVVEEIQSFPLVYKNPVPATDIIIEYYDGSKKKGIVLIKRKNPPFGLALPGGFAEYGISLEDNAVKEAKEETGLDVVIENPEKPFCVQSNPKRDPRCHTISIVFIGRAQGKFKAGDDAKEVKVYTLSELIDFINKNKIVFDHSKILLKYLDYCKMRY